MYYAKMSNGNEVWQQQKSELWTKMWQRSIWEWDRASEEYFVFSAFGWIFIFVLPKKKMQWTTCPIFFFKFLDGWILFAIFATKKDASEIKLRERGSLYQPPRLSLEGTASGCSSSRLLPQSLYVRESLWKIASLLSKNMEAKLQNIMTHLDIYTIYCLCSSSAINIDNVTRSS